MKKVSIIIPAYNEEKSIAEIVKRVQAATILSLDKEIIVVDNNSSDKTFEIVKNISGIKVFLEKTRGKGAAVKRGFKEAQGDILTIQDADLEYDPQDLANIIKPILEEKTKVVNGIRIDSRRRDDWKIYFLGWIGNHVITWLTNILYLNNAKEYEGCYKAFKKEIIDSITVKADGFDFDNELLCKILKRGHKILDIPIHYYPRNYNDGKKIDWQDGLKIIWTIVKCRFTK